MLLARALAQIWEETDAGARYLLLDEPTASLDPAQQHRVLRAVHRFARTNGVGVCVVMHDLNLAAQYADRLLLMKEGRGIPCGVAHEVLTRPYLRACYGVEAEIMRHPRLPVPLVVTAA